MFRTIRKLIFENFIIISLYYKMTDVSTYIEAEDYVETFYDKYYSVNNSSKIINHTAVYIDTSDITNVTSISKDSKKIAEICNTS